MNMSLFESTATAPAMDDSEAKPSPFGPITIKHLYFFIWKIAIAGFLFLLPFVALWWLIGYSVTH